MEQPNGLKLITEFITPEEETLLIKKIDEQKWDTRLKRRTQHYGWEYSYTKGPLEKAEPIPSWINFVTQKMIDLKYINEHPDQLIINEYMPGQGIGEHKDSTQFEETIISVSLASTCLFQFLKGYNSDITYDVFLQPRTMVIMKDESRYLWTHHIPARKIDIIDNHRKKRERRVSLTFRYVPFETKYNECKKKIIKWIKDEYIKNGWKFFNSVLYDAKETIENILMASFKKKYPPSTNIKRYEAIIIWNYIRREPNIKELIYNLYQKSLIA